MKKRRLFACLLVLLILVSAAGCGNADKQAKKAEDTKTSSQGATQSNDTVRFGAFFHGTRRKTKS